LQAREPAAEIGRNARVGALQKRAVPVRRGAQRRLAHAFLPLVNSMSLRISNLLLLAPTAAALASAGGAQDLLQLKSNAGSGGAFGATVVIVGDVNGDNRDDLAVGIPSDDSNTLTDRGRVQVLSGLDGSVLYELYGTAAGDRFGASLCAFGADLNFDGVNDFSVGAPGADPGGLSSSGQVKTISGATGATIATFNGSAVGDQFGYSIASAGNTSGAYRIVIGAPYRNQGALNNAGAAYVYFATGGFLKEYTGSQANELTGFSVSGGFDTNGDGVRDIVVGSPDWDDTVGGLTSAGRVRVYSAVSPYSLLETQSGGGSGYRMGASVAMLQKWDADTSADYAVGMPGASFGGTESGGVYVFSGASGAILNTISSFNSDDHAGTALASLGDVNNDGRTDLLVGAPDAENGALLEAGVAKVISGINGSVLYTVNGTTAGQHLGAGVGGGGDINNDNRNDFVVGAPDAAQSGPNQGRILARSGLNNSTIFTTQGPLLGDRTGTAVANVGDINNDGKDDWAVGYPYYDVITGPPFPVQAIDCGKVEIYSGADGSVLRGHSNLTIGGNFGWSIANIGDVNNDGRADYAIGEPMIDAPTPEPGVVRVYSGLNGSLLATHTGLQNGDQFGRAISGCGDVNANGEVDVLIGIPNFQNGALLSAGRVEARGAISGSVALSRSGLNAGAHFGWSVSGLYGDVTNDAVPQMDVVVGEPEYSVGLSNRGRVYVLAQPSTVVTTIDGGLAGQRLGYSVAGAGDLNFDGKADFVVGSIEDDALGLTNRGSVRAISAYNGGGIWTRYGTATSERLGVALARLGDLDLDGVSEIAAGGSPTAGAPSLKGFVEILSGKDGKFNFRLDGTLDGDSYGAALSSGLDFNNDGVSGLAVGAPLADYSSKWSGVAYLYDLSPKGVTAYGTGTAGCAGMHAMRTSSAAKIGNVYLRFLTNHAPVNSLGLMLITDAQDAVGHDTFGVGILMHVGFIGAVDVYALDTVSDSFGGSWVLTPVPNNPALVGKAYYAQSIWAWSAECVLAPYQLSSSQGLQVIIQP